jgi:hypothetical protein
MIVLTVFLLGSCSTHTTAPSIQATIAPGSWVTIETFLTIVTITTVHQATLLMTIIHNLGRDTTHTHTAIILVVLILLGRYVFA